MTVNVGPVGPRGEAEVDAMDDHCSGRGEGGVKGTQNTGWAAGRAGGEDILLTDRLAEQVVKEGEVDKSIRRNAVYDQGLPHVLLETALLCHLVQIVLCAVFFEACALGDDGEED